MSNRQMKLFKTDYVIVNERGSMYRFSNNGDVCIYGDKHEAINDANFPKSNIVATTELSLKNQEILLKQINC